MHRSPPRRQPLLPLLAVALLLASGCETQESKPAPRADVDIWEGVGKYNQQQDALEAQRRAQAARKSRVSVVPKAREDLVPEVPDPLDSDACRKLAELEKAKQNWAVRANEMLSKAGTYDVFGLKIRNPLLTPQHTLTDGLDAQIQQATMECYGR